MPSKVDRMTRRQGSAVRHPRSSAVLAVVGLVAALAIGAVAWIYTAELAVGPPVRSDATGYYLYLPAVLIDRDVTMERTAERSFAGQDLELRRVSRRQANGRILDKYTAGEAILLLPFFAAGHIGAIASGAERNGFSRPYQAAAVAGGLTYALLGLALLGFLLLRWFSAQTVVVTLLAVVFGTPLFHYATFDAVFSHAFSFFLVALTLTAAVALRERPGAPLAAALGFTIGLLTLIRPPNAAVLLVVALVGVVDVRSLSGRVETLRHNLGLVALGAVAFLLPWLPQLAYWHAITGRLLVYTYGDERLDLLHPHLLQVLFSVRKGLFFWSPLLLLAVVGLPLLRRAVPGLFLAATGFLIVDTWVIASWETWWYGGSLGQRPFVDALPVFALGLAALVEWARGRVTRPVMLAGTGVCTLLAVHATLAYWIQAIPYDGTTWQIYLHSFEKLYS